MFFTYYQILAHLAEITKIMRRILRRRQKEIFFRLSIGNLRKFEFETQTVVSDYFCRCTRVDKVEET